LHEQVRRLTELAQIDQNERSEKSLMATVDELVSGYPVFGESEHAGAFALDAIKSDLAAARANGDLSRGDVEKIVSQRAVSLQRVLRDMTPRAPEGFDTERVPRELETPAKPFTADDLMNGSIARHINQGTGARRI
jgi:hypothetical protein